MLLAAEALELLAKWLGQTIGSIPPILLMLIAIGLVTIFIIALVKKWTAVAISMALVVSVISMLWIYAGPGAKATLGLHHPPLTTLGSLVAQQADHS